MKLIAAKPMKRDEGDAGTLTHVELSFNLVMRHIAGRGRNKATYHCNGKNRVL